MTEISKKEKVDNQPNPDFLSNLPLSIIHIILARVSIREAVRTCVLSRQWRNTWASLPELVFEENCPELSDDESVCKFEECMENFITNVLFRHEGPIHKFKMSVSFRRSSPNFDQWVLCLSRKDIKELIIDMNYEETCFFKLHSSIYSCEDLTYLELFNCELDPPPSTFDGFFYLRGLHLRDVCLPGLPPDGIESVFEYSPLLEKLDLMDSGGSGLWIDAPNLKHLFLRGEYIEISLYAPFLAEMRLELHDNNFTPDYIREDGLVCNYTDFLGGFTNLEKLMGDYFTMKYLSVGIGSCRQSLVFPHLKVIKLSGVDSKNIREMLFIALLAVGAPNLEKLTVDSRHILDSQFDPNIETTEVSYMDFRRALSSTFKKLRVVKMEGVSGLPVEMEFIKYLLENSPVLELMRVTLYYDLEDEEEQIVTDALLGCTCASPIAKISIL